MRRLTRGRDSLQSNCGNRHLEGRNELAVSGCPLWRRWSPATPARCRAGRGAIGCRRPAPAVSRDHRHRRGPRVRQDHRRLDAVAQDAALVRLAHKRRRHPRGRHAEGLPVGRPAERARQFRRSSHQRGSTTTGSRNDLRIGGNKSSPIEVSSFNLKARPPEQDRAFSWLPHRSTNLAPYCCFTRPP
jgi:hypothetical protein